MVGYRKLNPGDARQFGEHMARLDADDRRSRFAGTVSDREIHRYCAGLDWRHTTIIGFFDQGMIRAAVELRMEPGVAEPAAEAAFSVERGFQGKGIGSALLRRIVTVAQNTGIRHLSVICQPGNWRMRQMLAKFNAESEVDIQEVVASIRLRPADPFSLAQESFDDGSGLMPILFDQWCGNLMRVFVPGMAAQRQAA